MKSVDQLLVVDALLLGRRLVDALPDAESLCRIGADAGGSAAVLGDELAHKYWVSISRRASGPTCRNHDPLSVGPELAGVSVALVRAGRLDERLRVVVLGDECLDERH